MAEDMDLPEAFQVDSWGEEDEFEEEEEETADTIEVRQMAGLVAKPDLPEAFQVDSWGEEDEYEEGVEPGDTIESRQKKAREEGMIPVAGSPWQEVNEKIFDITGRQCSVADAIQKASKGTCYLRRGSNSKDRIDYHERLAEGADSAEKKEYHEKKASSAKKGILGVGTGLLLSPRSIFGYLVITNNHVIMNEEEAKNAQVIFDYLFDGSKEGSTQYKVCHLVAFSPRTESAEDTTSLDFSVVVLDANEYDPFLEQRCVSMEETDRIQSTSSPFLKLAGLKALPLIMVSHPLGLGMRISVGQYPEGVNKYPVSHIKHCLPTLPGSSGANLLFSSVHDKSFTHWRAAFLHYRHGCAAAWQAIAPQLRVAIEPLLNDVIAPLRLGGAIALPPVQLPHC